MKLRAAVTLLVFSVSATSAHLAGGGTVTLAEQAEAARIARVALTRTRRLLVEACLARETAKLAGPGERGEASAGAAAGLAGEVYGRCSPVLEDYAASLLSLAPLPGEGQPARLVGFWKPYYCEDIARHLLAPRSAAPEPGEKAL